MKDKFKRKLARSLPAFRLYGADIVLLSVVTGVFAGVIVTFYNICTGLGEEYSRALYELVRAHPAFIPLLLVGLAAGAVAIGTLVRFVPMIRGSGIPQIEGACRGKFPFNWYVTLCSMFAASLACVFLGLAAGSEGPSIEMGGCVGEGAGRLLRRNFMVRRLQIAAGASAGFAVAFNAPLTGTIFAMEEAFRSFSPQIFVSAAVAVATAVGVRAGIRLSLGFSVGPAFENFVLVAPDISGYGFFALAALVSALAAVAFYYAAGGLKKLFGRMSFWGGAGKFVVPFVLSGACGLVTAFAMGGGHDFISSLTSPEGMRVFGMSAAASLALIVALRFALMTSYMACGVPCGVFVPMLAVGAGIGALLSSGFVSAGMDAAFGHYLIAVSMSAFFTAFVRAPVTGLFMVFELTGQFTNALPALMGVVIASLVAEICRTEPGYENNLHAFMRDRGFEGRERTVRVTAVIRPGSPADGAKINRLLWPSGGLVTSLTQADGTPAVPSGGTRLRAGQTMQFECRAAVDDDVEGYIAELSGDDGAKCV